MEYKSTFESNSLMLRCTVQPPWAGRNPREGSDVLPALPEKAQSHLTGPPKNRQRRNRTMFSDHAVRRLEIIFESKPYPDIYTREQIASELNISESRVQVWFQNRRSRKRKTTGTTGKCKPTETIKSMPHKPIPISCESSFQQQPAFISPYVFGFSPVYQPAQIPALHADYRNFMNILPSSNPWYITETPTMLGFSSPTNTNANDGKSSPEVSSTTSTPNRKKEACIQREFSCAETRHADASKYMNLTLDSDCDTSLSDKCSSTEDDYGKAIDLSTKIRQ